jgi:hypothetical protein
MFDTNDFNRKLKQHRAAVSEVNAQNKAAVFEVLSAAGITRIDVTFDGEGDSGQIQEVAAFSGETSDELPTTVVTLASTQWGADDTTTREMPLPEAVEELCYGYLEQKHDGWENNDGAFGEFTFDVGERNIALEFHARYTDTLTSHHTF